VTRFDGMVTFCYTADLDRSAAFYEGVLGLRLALDQGACRIYAVADHACLGLCTRADAARPDGIILTLVTDDVDGWYARLRERVDIAHPPRLHPDHGIYHFFLRDPDGYLLEIQRFVDPPFRP